MAKLWAPAIGMRVRFTRADHKAVPLGRGGVIDVVADDGIHFWVVTDCGGFFGWTSAASWEQGAPRPDPYPPPEAP